MNQASPAAAPPEPPTSAHDAGATSPLVESLGQISRALETVVGIDSPLVAQLRVLLDRLRHETLQIAILGQFKRGKSTFVNALLGAPLLPTGVVPLTSVATFIRWDKRPRIVVSFKNAQSQEFDASSIDDIRATLFQFVAEEANPNDRLGVARVELFYPAAILADGMSMIDTPGVGSTFRHNTEAALRVLPECDAAFFVSSVDPPITEVEIDFLKRVRSKAERLFFVLNKIDYLPPDERHAATSFLRKVLEDNNLIQPGEKIFFISARAALEAKCRGDRNALEASGVADLEDHVLRVLAVEKCRLLDESVRQKAATTIAQASQELALRRRALEMPVEVLAEKSRLFQESLHSVGEQRRLIGDLFGSEHRRLRDALDVRVDQLRKEARTKVARVIDQAVSGRATNDVEGAVSQAFKRVLIEEFEAARDSLVSEFSRHAEASLQTWQNRVDTLVGGIQRTAALMFDLPLADAWEHEGFMLAEDPYWVTEGENASLIPDLGRWLDPLLPAKMRRRRLRARAVRQAGEAIVRNGENLRWAIVRGLDETYRNAAMQFQERLDQVIDATRNIIVDALTRRDNREIATKAEIDRIAAAVTLLATLRSRLENDEANLEQLNVPACSR
ncbi:MAG TPA: dynamin family protein [Xanthobacteraceae bacterium]|nr:dynamin family protein [Xanthobacteraceae bacterium]